MKRNPLVTAIFIVTLAISAAAKPRPNAATAPEFPGTLANGMFMLPPTMEISSIRTSFQKIEKRSAPCRMPFRIGAN